uniref:Uncharacterized protein n=1 Tax=Anguilla anguilla TaxID=7936 RepID=A0A0E9R0V3_ANGAN
MFITFGKHTKWQVPFLASCTALSQIGKCQCIHFKV